MAKDRPVEEARRASNAPQSSSPREQLAGQIPPDVPVPRPAEGEPNPDPQEELRRRLASHQPQQQEPPADDRDALIARLQAQVAALQRGEHAGPDERARLKVDLPTQDYRVSLAGARVQLSSVVVGPRLDPGPLAPPAPVETYDTLALAMESPAATPQDAAWRRYAEKYSLDLHRNRSQYRCRVQPGDTVESIVVAAVSPADAEHAYRRFCGVLTTDQPFTTELVSGKEGA